MNQSFSKLWIIGILVVLIAGGVFAWQYFSIKKEGVRPSEIAQDETAGWQTYRNEEFGFEVKYPGELVIDFEHRGFISGSDYYGTRDFNFLITNSKKEPSLASDVDGNLEYDGYNFALFSGFVAVKHLANFNEVIVPSPSRDIKSLPVNVAGIDYIISSISYSPPHTINPHSQIYFPMKGYTVIVTTGNYSIKTMAKILSTFRFIENVSNWQTYRNERYGFEFQHPEDYLLGDLSPFVEGVRIYSKEDILPLIDFAFYENPDSMSVGVNKFPRTFRDLMMDTNLSNVKEENFKDNDAFRATFINEFVNVEKNELYIYHNGHVYVLSVDVKYGDRGEQIFQQILSTFEFVE